MAKRIWTSLKNFPLSVLRAATAAVGVPGALATDEHSKKEQYRILIIGKTGNGKSSIANAILGQQKFAVGSTMASTTLKVQSEQLERDDCLWMVVDTPDPFNSEVDTKQLKEEIQKLKQMTAPFPSTPAQEVLREVDKSVAVAEPGPHVISMVLLSDKQFTVELIQRNGGQHINNMCEDIGMDVEPESMQQVNDSQTDATRSCKQEILDVLKDCVNVIGKALEKALGRVLEIACKMLLNHMLQRMFGNTMMIAG